MVVAVPGRVVRGVRDETAGRGRGQTVPGGGEERVEVVVHLLDGHRIVLDQVVELVAELETDEVGPVGERAAENTQQLRLGLDGLGVREHVAVVPAAGPLRIEVEARQMALHSVHEDVETGLGRQVDELDQLVDGRGSDQCAVGLQERPEVEDADVVEAERGYLGEVLAGVGRIEVVPGVEPAAAGRVVHSEAGRGRAGYGGSADGVLLGNLCPTRGRGLFSANVSTTMVANEQ